MADAEAMSADPGFIADLIGSVGGFGMAQSVDQKPEGFIKVNEEMYVAGQIDSSTVPQIVELGIKSVFNLRDESEDGYHDFPDDLPEGVERFHCPIPDNAEWSEPSIDTLLASLDKCNTPALVYCKTGARAVALGVAHTATRSRFHEGKLIHEGTNLSAVQKQLLDTICGGVEDCQMKKFVQEYIGKKVANAVARPGLTQIKPDLYVTGQLSEDELKEMKDKGIVSVLNCRPLTEAGQFGLGVLAREEEIVKSLGMDYAQIAVPKNGPYTAELTAEVLEKIMSLKRPLLIHCRTGRRVQDIMQGMSGI